MPPNAPKAPAEPDWELLRQKKPAFSVKHIDEIAELSARYLDADALVFSEDDIISNIYLLWKMSKKSDTKISKKHAKEVEKIVLSAFGRHIHGSGTHQTHKSMQKDHPNKFKPGSDELDMPNRAKNILSRWQYFQEGKSYQSKAEKTADKEAKREYYLKAAECYEKSGRNKRTGNAYQMVAEYSENENWEDKELYFAKASLFYEMADRGDLAGRVCMAAGHAAKEAKKDSSVYGAYFAKAEENYVRAFKKGRDLSEANRQIGFAYGDAAEHFTSLEDKEFYFAKAGDFLVKGGVYGWAGREYMMAGHVAKDAKKDSSVYETYYAKAEENYSAAGDNALKKGDLSGALNEYHYAAMNANGGKKAEYYLKMARLSSKKVHWRYRTMDNYCQAAIYTSNDTDAKAYLTEAKKFASSDVEKGHLSEQCGHERECSPEQKERLFVDAAAEYRKAKDPERIGDALKWAAYVTPDNEKKIIYLSAALKEYQAIDRPDLEAVALAALAAFTFNAKEEQEYKKKTAECVEKAEKRYRGGPDASRLDSMGLYLLQVSLRFEGKESIGERFAQLAEQSDNLNDKFMAYVEAIKNTYDPEQKLELHLKLAPIAVKIKKHEVAGFAYGEIAKMTLEINDKVTYSVRSAGQYLKTNATLPAACAYFNAAQYEEKKENARKYLELAKELISKAEQEILAAEPDENKRKQSLLNIYAQAHVATYDPKMKEQYYSRFLEITNDLSAGAKMGEYRIAIAQHFEELASDTDDKSKRAEFFSEAGRNYYNLKMPNKAIECYRLAIETCEDKLKKLSYELLLNSISGEMANLN